MWYPNASGRRPKVATRPPRNEGVDGRRLPLSPHPDLPADRVPDPPPEPARRLPGTGRHRRPRHPEGRRAHVARRGPARPRPRPLLRGPRPDAERRVDDPTAGGRALRLHGGGPPAAARLPPARRGRQARRRIVEHGVPMSEAEIRAMHPDLPSGFGLRQALEQEPRLTLFEGRWQARLPDARRAADAPAGARAPTRSRPPRAPASPASRPRRSPSAPTDRRRASDRAAVARPRERDRCAPCRRPRQGGTGPRRRGRARRGRPGRQSDVRRIAAATGRTPVPSRPLVEPSLGDLAAAEAAASERAAPPRLGLRSDAGRPGPRRARGGRPRSGRGRGRARGPGRPRGRDHGDGRGRRAGAPSLGAARPAADLTRPGRPSDRRRPSPHPRAARGPRGGRRPGLRPTPARRARRAPRGERRGEGESFSWDQPLVRRLRLPWNRRREEPKEPRARNAGARRRPAAARPAGRPAPGRPRGPDTPARQPRPAGRAVPVRRRPELRVAAARRPRQDEARARGLHDARLPGRGPGARSADAPRRLRPPLRARPGARAARTASGSTGRRCSPAGASRARRISRSSATIATCTGWSPRPTSPRPPCGRGRACSG
jgi:hypothetical protein